MPTRVRGALVTLPNLSRDNWFRREYNGEIEQQERVSLRDLERRRNSKVEVKIEANSDVVVQQSRVLLT